jgi:hypothetical protein
MAGFGLEVVGLVASLNFVELITSAVPPPHDSIMPNWI